MAFEQLMADAQLKKKEEKKQRSERFREKHGKKESSSKESARTPSHYAQTGTGEKYNPNA